MSHDDRAQLVANVREADEKCRVLHEARMKAWDEMKEASAQSEFLVAACRHAQEDADQARHGLESAIRREAWELGR